MNVNKKRIASVASKVFATLNALGLIFLVIYSLHVCQKFNAIHKEMGLDVPVVTQAVINVPAGAWILTAVILLAIIALKEKIARKWIPILLNCHFVLIGVVYWVIFSAIVIVLPLMQLAQQINY